jgi:hypothetical protein
LNPSEKATSAIPLNPTFALVGVRIFPQFSIFFGQPHQIPAQSEVQGLKTANSLRPWSVCVNGPSGVVLSFFSDAE